MGLGAWGYFCYSILCIEMEKRFNLKVSVRIRDKCKETVDQVSFNNLILCGSAPDEHKKFHVDKIYSPNDNNEKLFENMLRAPSNLLLEGFSSMILCLGSPNSGKTYSLAGKTSTIYNEESDPGVMVYLMRRLFSKFKHEVSLNSTYSFWCKFLFVERDKVYDNNEQFNELDWQKNFNSIIQIKSYSHFEEIIAMVYRNNNNKCHTIIQLILQKQAPNQEATTSSITFVEFGSFFYNCPYREAEQLSMENDIEATLLVIKSLSKTKENAINSSMFDSSLLTKVLKKNFLKVCCVQFLGLLDDSHQNNLKTLNFLDIIMHKKENHASSRNAKEQIKREENLLKSLYEKHRKVLNLLSRCIGMELGYLDKQKKKKNLDGPILNTFYKTCEKIKYANQKKQQNERELQEIRKNIEKEQSELDEIQTQYRQKLKNLDMQKKTLFEKKQGLINYLESIKNPAVKFSSADSSLFFKVDDHDQKSHKKSLLEEEIMQNASLLESDRDSKNEKDFKAYQPSSSQITTRKNLLMRIGASAGKERLNQKYHRKPSESAIVLAERRLHQLKSQVGRMFGLIYAQQIQIQARQKQIPQHLNKIHNKIKSHSLQIGFDIAEARQCYTLACRDSNPGKQYAGMLQNLQIQAKIEKQIATNTITSMNAISLRSLKSEKHVKVL